MEKKLSEALKMLNEKRKTLQDALEDAAKEGKKGYKKTVKSVEKDVRKNPWVYIGGAAAVGLVIGLILSRRKN